MMTLSLLLKMKHWLALKQTPLALSSEELWVFCSIDHVGICCTIPNKQFMYAHTHTRRYLDIYEPHKSLLDGSASADLDAFLKEEQDLEYIGKVGHRVLLCGVHVLMGH